MTRLAKGVLATGVISGLSLFGGARAVDAAIVPTLESVAPESSFRWTYSAHGHSLAAVEPGDFFTIYDFRGLVPDSNTQPDGWSFDAQFVGQTPDGLSVPDDPAVVNLVWTRTGDALATGLIDLGQFSVLSAHGQEGAGWFTSSATRAVGFPMGSAIDVRGQVAVPIPLPAATLMFIPGAMVAGVLYRRMRRQGC